MQLKNCKHQKQKNMSTLILHNELSNRFSPMGNYCDSGACLIDE